MSEPVKCPACDNPDPRFIGTLLKKEGLLAISEPGSLYECKACRLMFRRPYPSDQELREAYSGLTDEIWSYPGGRADFSIAREAILQCFTSGKVLDVGCFRGDFLSQLPEGFDKYGVEPAVGARQKARDTGIKLIGSTIDDLETDAAAFDVITLLDVIEHLPLPFASMQKLIGMLRPGGMMIVSTGNTRALPWRLMRQHYWYYYTEHVSFFCPDWFRWAAAKLHSNVTLVRKFSHYPSSPFVQLRQLVKALACRVAFRIGRRHPKVHSWIMKNPRLRRYFPWPATPDTGQWRDHMVVAVKRQAAAGATSGD